MQAFFDALLWLGERAGYALGALFILLGLAALVGVFTARDDGFQPIGESRPPAPRVSPFASPPARPGSGDDAPASAPGNQSAGRGAGGSPRIYSATSAEPPATVTVTVTPYGVGDDVP